MATTKAPPHTSRRGPGRPRGSKEKGRKPWARSKATKAGKKDKAKKKGQEVEAGETKKAGMEKRAGDGMKLHTYVKPTMAPKATPPIETTEFNETSEPTEPIEADSSSGDNDSALLTRTRRRQTPAEYFESMRQRGPRQPTDGSGPVPRFGAFFRIFSPNTQAEMREAGSEWNWSINRAEVRTRATRGFMERTGLREFVMRDDLDDVSWEEFTARRRERGRVRD
ncbi:Uu.00g133750.m01.CDS01 [Anthostomella pinea]|uniref:Uu.00g133750.m01.CDS01 n=1 Tax=Anthostomella pinea TaxID=933095 RepID=A0AAI8VNT1_9PEZI|nr:Uu.00g133750.m01.CDS01 [Anthostomella pinea]